MANLMALEWAEFLGGFDFDTFFTMTYGNPATSGENAISRAHRVLKKFFRAKRIPLCAFVVAEEHKLGGFHCHGLVRLNVSDQEQQKELCRELKAMAEVAYGFSRFSPIKKAGAAQTYVSKYLTKQVAAYEFFGKSSTFLIHPVSVFSAPPVGGAT